MNFKENTTFYYFLLLLLTFCTQLQAQKVADSLKDVSYDYMWERYYADTTRAAKIIYTDAIIARTKKEGDTATLMGGYELRSYLYQKNDGDRYLTYLDSIIEIGKLKRINNYPEKIFIRKGIYYYHKDNLKKALINFIKAEDLIENNEDLIGRNYNHIGIIKDRLGDKEGALESFQKSLNLLNKNTKASFKSFLPLYFNISTIYNEHGKLDSAKNFIRKGLNLSKEIKDNESYYSFKINEGINLYFRNKNKLSEEMLLSYVDSLYDIKDKAHTYFYLGKLNKRAENWNKSVSYYKTTDSIINSISSFNPFYRDLYVDLIDYYKKENDLNEQFYYLNKLIILDSINHENKVFLNRNLFIDYEIPKLKAERDDIIKEIKQKDQRKRSWIIVLLVGSILILSGFIYQYYRRKSFQTKFLTLYNNQDNQRNITTYENARESSNQLDISEEIINHILAGLQQFENGHDYLRTELTLPILAKELQTNSKYLSKVISTKKGKTFVQYINGLRVNYTIKRLKDDLSFRKYTLLAIANEVGFKKNESFTKAFKKETGITPFYFIKELQKKDLNLFDNNASVLL